MTTETFVRVALGPALSLLPERMDTPEARVLLTAICLQESALRHRRQLGGPARGLAQFEVGGVLGVARHRATATWAGRVCHELSVPFNRVPDVHAALELNDPLCLAFARLLLWTLPKPLPAIGDEAEAWAQYLEAWRPGKPRPEKWEMSYRTALEAIVGPDAEDDVDDRTYWSRWVSREEAGWAHSGEPGEPYRARLAWLRERLA